METKRWHFDRTSAMRQAYCLQWVLFMSCFGVRCLPLSARLPHNQLIDADRRDCMTTARETSRQVRHCLRAAGQGEGSGKLLARLECLMPLPVQALNHQQIMAGILRVIIRPETLVKYFKPPAVTIKPDEGVTSSVMMCHFPYTPFQFVQGQLLVEKILVNVVKA
jgi:hypothetical protein